MDEGGLGGATKNGHGMGWGETMGKTYEGWVGRDNVKYSLRFPIVARGWGGGAH